MSDKTKEAEQALEEYKKKVREAANMAATVLGSAQKFKDPVCALDVIQAVRALEAVCR